MSPDGVSMDEVRVIVSLGSNIEPRLDYLNQALEALKSLPSTRLISASRIIETHPVDVPQQFSDQLFLNQVAVFMTTLPPHDFSHLMHRIEDALGRVRTLRNGPRTIDLDIIDFGGMTSNDPSLTLPHPRAREREFVMAPLRELGISL